MFKDINENNANISTHRGLATSRRARLAITMVVIFAVIAIALAMPHMANAVDNDENVLSYTYKYNDEDNTAKITGLSSGSGYFPSIPEKVIYKSKTYYVVEIADGAFKNRSNVNGNLTIPKTIITIGNEAFYGCTSLEGIEFVEGVQSIGRSAFEGCTALKLINNTLPDSIANIDDRAFFGCTSLGNMNFGKGLISIGKSAFEGCVNLYSKKGTFNLPPFLNSIGNRAFYGCTKINTDIIFGERLQSIGSYAFSGCTQVFYLKIPSNISYIGNCAFENMPALSVIDFKETDPSITIGTDVFKGLTLYDNSGLFELEQSADGLVGKYFEKIEGKIINALDPVKYSIVAKPVKEGTGKVTGSGEYEIGSIIRIIATANHGYVFKEWTDHVTDADRTIVVRGQTEYDALFEHDTIHQITYFLDGGIGETPKQEPLYKGDRFEIAKCTATKPGYIFVCWHGNDGNNYKPGDICTVKDENIHLIAVWGDTPTHTIHFNVNGGSIEMKDETFNEGRAYMLPDYEGTREAKKFVGWLFDGKVYSAGSQLMLPNKDVTLTATWEDLPKHAVTFDANGGTGVLPASFEVYEGGKFTLPNYSGTKAGYYFGGWEYNGRQYPVGTEMTMGKSIMNFVAVWNPNPTHTVTFDENGGSKKIDPIQVAEGLTFTIPGYDGVKAGYQFAGWSDGKQVYMPGDKATMGKADIKLTAKWTENAKHKVVYYSNGGTGEVPKQSDVIEGLTFVVADYKGTKSGYYFAGWQYNGKIYEAGAVITMGNHDIHLIAQWAESPSHTVNFDENGGSIHPESTTAVEGVTYLIPGYDGVKHGWEFVGWSIDGKTYKPDTPVVMGKKDVTLVAVWEKLDPITISYDVNGGTGPAPESVQAYTWDVITVADYTGTKAGFYFEGWEYNGIVYAPGSYKLVLDENIKFVAKWTTKPSHLVTFDANGGSIPGITKSVIEGTVHTIPGYEGVKAGYTFDGWMCEGVLYKEGQEVTMGDHDVTMVAQWKENPKHNVTYDTNGGTGEAPKQSPVSEGMTFTLASYHGTKSGYYFAGWELDGKVYPATSKFTMGTTDLKFVAHWEKVQTHTISFDVDGGSIAKEPLTVEHGSVYTVPGYNGVKEGYTFIGWMYNGALYKTGGKITVNDDVRLVAKWEEKTKHKITYDTDGGSEKAPIQSDVYEGGKFIVANYSGTKAGYEFKGWLYNGMNYAPGTEFTVEKNDIYFKANWGTAPKYTITFDVDGGSKKMDPSIATKGIKWTVPYYYGTKEGYYFAGWNDGEKTYQPGDMIDVTRNLTLKAVWKDVASHTASFDINGGTGKAPASITKKEGAEFTLPECSATKTGYYFAGWKYNGSIHPAGTVMKMATGDMKFVAEWKPKASHIVYYDENGGSKKVNPIQVAEGETYILPTYDGTKYGYTFIGWECDGKISKPGTSHVMGTADVKYIAYWEKKAEHKVTYELAGGSGEAPSQSFIPENEKFTLADYKGTKAGYTFIGWKYGDKTYPVGATMTMGKEDMNFIASWQANPSHKVTVDVNGGSVEIESFEMLEGKSFIIGEYEGTKAGYDLVGWSCNDKVYKVGDTFTMGNKDVIFTAVWKEKAKHHVIYDTDGGSKPAPVQADVHEGRTFVLANYDGTKESYTFVGWEYNGNTYKPGTTLTMGKEDIKLIAKWSQNPSHLVKFDTAGGDIPMDPVVVVEGTYCVVPGYEGKLYGKYFVSWTCEGKEYKPGEQVIMGNHDVTLTAKWADKPKHNVTFDIDGGSGKAPSSMSVPEGENFVLPTYDGTKYGYMFTGWKYGEKIYAPKATLTMGSEDIKLVANWTAKKTHNVHFMDDGVEVSTFIAIEGETYTIGEYSVVKPGFTFVGWICNGTLYKTGDKVVMGKSDVTMVAKWEEKPKHSVTYDTKGGSEPAPLQSDVHEGERFIAAAYSGTKEGYYFSGWYNNGVTYQPGTEIVMGKENMKLDAVWTKMKAHRVSFDTDGGEPQLQDVTVYDGKTYVVPGYDGVKAGYYFYGWSCEGKTLMPGDSIVVGDHDVTLKAIWKEKATHTVTYDPNGGTGEAPKSIKVHEGETFTIANYTGYKEGFHFAGWSYNGKTYSPGSTTTMGTEDIAFVAVWSTNPEHTIFFDVDGGSKKMDEVVAIEGRTYTVPGYDGTKFGYIFIGWTCEGVVLMPGQVVVMGDHDIKLTAIWNEKTKHKVTYDANGGTGDVPTQSDVYEGEKFILADYHGYKMGTKFIGWTYNGQTYPVGASITMDKYDIVLMAAWGTNPEHTVSFNVDGGSVEVEPFVATEGVLYYVPGYDGTKFGYAFVGWEIEGKIYNEGYPMVMGDHDVTLKAVWKEKAKHHVIYKLEGGSGEAPIQSDVYEGEYFTIAYYFGEKEGYYFSGWEMNGEIYGPGASMKMGTSDIFFFAYWTEKPNHYVSFDVNGGSKPVEPVGVQEGAICIVPGYDGVKEGYAFEYWTCDGAVLMPGSTVTMGDEDITLVAQWKAIKTHSVTYLVDGGSENPPVQSDVYEGDYFIIADYKGTKAGYHFSGWYIEDEGTKAAYAPGSKFMMGTQSLVFVALWTENPSHIVYYYMDGGSEYWPAEMVVEGAECEVPEYTGTKAGYTFKCWWSETEESNGHELYPGEIVKMASGDVLLIALWTENVKHTVSYDVGEGSEDPPEAKQYMEGETFIVADYGGEMKEKWFAGWTYNGVVYMPGQEVKMGEENIKFTAIWLDKDKVKLTLVAEPDSIKKITGAGDYVTGMKAKISVIPADGYKFLYWMTQDKSIYITEQTTTINMTEDIVLYAVMEKEAEPFPTMTVVLIGIVAAVLIAAVVAVIAIKPKPKP